MGVMPVATTFAPAVQVMPGNACTGSVVPFACAVTVVPASAQPRNVWPSPSDSAIVNAFGATSDTA